MNKLAGIVVFLTLSIFLNSCALLGKGGGKKQKRKAQAALANADTTAIALQPATTSNTVAVSDSAAVMAGVIAGVRPLWERRLQYRTFSGKAKVNYAGPNSSQDFTANFRVKKDSIIWIAVTGLGGLVQVARIYITPDSFYMINQLEKEVTRMPLRDAARLLPTPVDFNSLQNLIVGEPLRAGNILGAAKSADTWVLDVADDSYQQRVVYSEADSTLKTAQLRTVKPDGPRAVMDFSNYALVKDRKLSTARMINLQNGAEIYSFDMNFTNSDFDAPIDFPFSIPNNYSVKTW